MTTTDTKMFDLTADELRTDIGFRMEALREENQPESEDW